MICEICLKQECDYASEQGGLCCICNDNEEHNCCVDCLKVLKEVRK